MLLLLPILMRMVGVWDGQEELFPFQPFSFISDFFILLKKGPIGIVWYIAHVAFGMIIEIAFQR